MNPNDGISVINRLATGSYLSWRGLKRVEEG